MISVFIKKNMNMAINDKVLFFLFTVLFKSSNMQTDNIPYVIILITFTCISKIVSADDNTYPLDKDRKLLIFFVLNHIKSFVVNEKKFEISINRIKKNIYFQDLLIYFIVFPRLI